MYFAVNPTSPSLPAQIAQQITAMQEQHGDAPFHVIALVDGAFDEEFFKSSPRNRWPRMSLYANTSLQSLEMAAPQLTTFNGQPGKLEKWLENLFAHCSGKPMLSIIASALNAEALQRHLIPYMVCRTGDTVEWPVRWGDTRILPGLIENLTDSQRAHMLSPTYRWWAVGRAGEELAWTGNGAAFPLAAGFDKLPMTDSMFASLVELAEPDAILGAIDNSQSDVLQNLDPVEAHHTVSHHLKIATENRIEAAGARQHFSVLALVLAEGFTNHPAIAEALKRVRNGEEYFSEIAKLPEDFWDMTSLNRNELK